MRAVTRRRVGNNCEDVVVSDSVGMKAGQRRGV